MTEKLGSYKVHPFAAKLPLMVGDEFAELVRDIEANDLIEPIALTADQTTIIDGRNRWRACKEAKIAPKFRAVSAKMTEADILAFIVSKNVARRHLSVGQKAALAIEYGDAVREAAKQRQREHGKTAPGKKSLPAKSPGVKSDTRDQLAAMAGVGQKAIDQAQKVKDESPNLFAQLTAGTVSLNDAYKQARAKSKSGAESKPKAPKASAPVLSLKTHLGEDVPYKQPAAKPIFNSTNDQISWAAWSWNPVTGCLHGCCYCYARELATKPSYRAAYPVGFTPLFHHERLDAPANTTVPAEAAADARFKRVFVCSMADLYGKWVPDEWIEQVHASAIANPQWDYLMLTKFPRRYVGLALPPTAWLGTSVDEQKRVRLAEEAFREIKGVQVKWLSLEPLLAPLEFSDLTMFDWIVIGSQSATEQPDGQVAEFAPPFEWVARLVAQAREASCRVYLKPNLLGKTSPQSAGMMLPQEEPQPAVASGSLAA
jgi:protein gp37/ParB-like chromosome segregation protein Spo0J